MHTWYRLTLGFAGLWYKTDEDYNNNVPEHGVPLDIFGKMANLTHKKYFALLRAHAQLVTHLLYSLY
jgi:hypothetical protein